jgi:hypothetical protein
MPSEVAIPDIFVCLARMTNRRLTLGTWVRRPISDDQRTCQGFGKEPARRARQLLLHALDPLWKTPRRVADVVLVAVTDQIMLVK